MYNFVVLVCVVCGQHITQHRTEQFYLTFSVFNVQLKQLIVFVLERLMLPPPPPYSVQTNSHHHCITFAVRSHFKDLVIHLCKLALRCGILLIADHAWQTAIYEANHPLLGYEP